MSNPDRRPCQVDARHNANLPLNPWCPQFNSRLPGQSVGEIDDVAAGLLGHAPGVSGEVLFGGEEGEIDVIHVFGQDTLNKRRLVANCFELTKRLVVVEQANVMGGEITVADYVFQLAALEAGGPDD